MKHETKDKLREIATMVGTFLLGAIMERLARDEKKAEGPKTEEVKDEVQ